MKNVKWLRLLAVVSLAVSSTLAYAYDFNIDGIYYDIINGSSVSVTNNGDYSGKSYSGDVVIPETVAFAEKDFNVTEIGMLAFQGCAGVTSVVIPSSVVTIQESAFYGCTGLTSISLPDNLTTIGGGAFNGCTGLASISIPESVVKIESKAFDKTPWYEGLSDGPVYINKVFYAYKGTMPDNTDIDLAEGTVSISGKAFNGCTGLKSISMPNTVTEIGNSAFAGCSGLSSITFSDDLSSIGERAFLDCTGLSSISLPNSLTSIGAYAFASCSWLTDNIVPESVVIIEPKAFYDTPWFESLSDGVVYINNVLYTYKGTMPDNTDIAIKDGTVSISANAFAVCSGLKSVSIPNSVTKIGSGAFASCENLTSVVLPSNLTEIASGIFENCSNLASVTIPESVTLIGSKAFAGTALTEVTIPNSMPIIGFSTFSSTKLTSVTIPKSVLRVDERAFMYCDELTSVTSLNPVPPICKSAFDAYENPFGIAANCVLYVPRGRQLAYMEKEDYDWCHFAKIIDVNDSGVGDIVADDCVVRAADGVISVSGSNAMMQVFDLSGKRVWHGSAAQGARLARGIYLVRVADTIAKVVL